MTDARTNHETPVLPSHPEPLAQEQAGEMEHGGELGMVESHPNFVAGFKAGHAAGHKRATAALQAKDAEIARLKADAGRLDHLQSRLATVEVLPAGLAWKFQVGGFHGGASHNIRAAIDAAIRAQTGGEHG